MVVISIKTDILFNVQHTLTTYHILNLPAPKELHNSNPPNFETHNETRIEFKNQNSGAINHIDILIIDTTGVNNSTLS